MRNLLARLTGGRPMRRVECAFVDAVSHREVWRCEDRLGRRGLAEGPWALFRVPQGPEVSRG